MASRVPARSGCGAADAGEDFAAWVEPHLLAMKRLAGRLVRSAERDDVVQEALLRARRRCRVIGYRTDARRALCARWVAVRGLA